MPSIFGPLISLEALPSPWDNHSEDILQYTMDQIASDMQYRVRSRLDNGMDLRTAIRARTVTVRNDLGELVIKSADAEGSKDNTTVNDLLETAMIQPKIEGNQIIFRKIREEQLQDRNQSAINSAFRDSIALKFGNDIDNATRRVISENPELLLK